MASTRMEAAVLMAIACFSVLAAVPVLESADVLAMPTFPYVARKISFFQQENPTNAFFVVAPLAGHGGNFGALSVLDQPLTADVNSDSTVIGYARGQAAFALNLPANQTPGAAELLWTASIDDPRPGGYGNGTLSLRGYNDLRAAEREISIVSGTGDFRLAQGWAKVVTIFRDDATRVSTQSWTLYVFLPPFPVVNDVAFNLDLNDS